MVITVQCPSCATSFPVDTVKIPERGVSARCSACTAIFRVERPAEQPETIGVEEEVALAGPLPSVEVMPPVGVEEEAPSSAADEAVVEPLDEATVVEAEAEEEDADTSSDHGWGLEMREDRDTSSLEVTPMETVESTVEERRDKMSEGTFSWEPGGFETSEDLMEEEAQAEGEEAASGAVVFEAPEPAAIEAPEPPMPEPTKGFKFGHRDPHDKARRLARVLVSDMIMYNPDRHARALEGGTLKADFDDEIQKSWKEYVDQVGEEIASSTTYWPDALNDILAKGQQVF